MERAGGSEGREGPMKRVKPGVRKVNPPVCSSYQSQSVNGISRLDKILSNCKSATTTYQSITGTEK